MSDDEWARRFDAIYDDSPVPLHFDREGRAIRPSEWARLHGDRVYCRVGETTVGGCYVSTVWIGINHNFGGGAPLIFETMIFRQDDDGVDGLDWSGDYCERYATEAEALAGHEAAVTLVRATVPGVS